MEQVVSRMTVHQMLVLLMDWQCCVTYARGDTLRLVSHQPASDAQDSPG